MLATLRRSTVATGLIGLVVLAALGILAVGVLGARNLRAQVMEERTAKTRAVVEAATGVVEGYVARERAGELSRARAQDDAAAAVRRLRYAGNEYFWINDMQPAMIVHPMKPELEGKQIGDMADPDGVHLFREMVEVVKRSRSGFVGYRWPRPGEHQPVPKVSFV
ncbi:MAG: cache domain-containing protein [Mycobacterium leprae]